MSNASVTSWAVISARIDQLTISEATGKIDITFASPASFAGETFVDFTDGAGTGIRLASTAAMAFLYPTAANTPQADTLPALSTTYVGTNAAKANAAAYITITQAAAGAHAVPSSTTDAAPLWPVLKPPAH